MVTRLCALLAALFLLAACGQEIDADTEPAHTADADPIEEPSAAVSTSSPDDGLTALLLTLDDLPDGFMIDTEYDSGEGADDEFELIEGDAECAEQFGFDGTLDAPSEAVDYGEVGIDFSAGEFGPYLFHSIASVSAGQLRLEFAFLERTLSECDGETFILTDADGFTMEITVAQTYPFELDDRMVAFTMDMSFPGTDFSLDALMVLVQGDGTLSTFGSMAMSSDLLPEPAVEPLSDAEFEALVRLAIDRLPATVA